jgi:hypothetical protein
MSTKSSRVQEFKVLAPKSQNLLLTKTTQNKMIKKIEINDDVIKAVKNGKYVEGSVRIDAETGQLTFRAFNRKKTKHQKDKLICELETGWLKESAQRVKFFSSVKKSLSVSRVYQAMDDDLFEAMQNLKVVRN